MDMPAVACNVVCNAYVDELNSGYIIFHTSGDAEVAKPQMNNPAFGDAALGVATMETGTAVSDTDTTAGVIDHAHFLKNDDTIFGKMTCGLSGAEFNFTSLTFADGESLIVQSLTVTWTPVSMT